MGKTIREIADELGVSKTAVRQKLKTLGLSENLETIGNKILLDEQQELLVKSAFLKNQVKTENQNPVSKKTESVQMVSIPKSTLESIQEQLEVKDKQIEQLTAALEHTTASLQASQALHAGTMQRISDGQAPNKNEIPEKKSWWRFWK